jgi:hypothetical protein
MTLVLRPTRADDRGWIADAIRSEWGSLRRRHRAARRRPRRVLAPLAHHDERQRRGDPLLPALRWDWVAFHRDALTASRRTGPEIPEIGAHGIPLRHELVFEAPRGAAPSGTAGTGSP